MMPLNKKIKYLSIEDVKLIHHVILKKYGSTLNGIKDYNLLASSVNYITGPIYDEFTNCSELEYKAAKLCYSLIKNHPFIDGNKRTATASMNMFLIFNRYKLSPFKKSDSLIIEGVAANTHNIWDILDLIKRRKTTQYSVMRK